MTDNYNFDQAGNGDSYKFNDYMLANQLGCFVLYGGKSDCDDSSGTSKAWKNGETANIKFPTDQGFYSKITAQGQKASSILVSPRTFGQASFWKSNTKHLASYVQGTDTQPSYYYRATQYNVFYGIPPINGSLITQDAKTNFQHSSDIFYCYLNTNSDEPTASYQNTYYIYGFIEKASYSYCDNYYNGQYAEEFLDIEQTKTTYKYNVKSAQSECTGDQYLTIISAPGDFGYVYGIFRNDCATAATGMQKNGTYTTQGSLHNWVNEPGPGSDGTGETFLSSDIPKACAAFGCANLWALAKSHEDSYKKFLDAMGATYTKDSLGNINGISAYTTGNYNEYYARVLDFLLDCDGTAWPQWKNILNHIYSSDRKTQNNNYIGATFTANEWTNICASLKKISPTPTELIKGYCIALLKTWLSVMIGPKWLSVIPNNVFNYINNTITNNIVNNRLYAGTIVTNLDSTCIVRPSA